MHSSTVDPDRRRGATPASGTGRACPGSVVVERGRTGTRASLTRYGLVGTRSRISGASLTRGVGSGQARACPSPPPSVCSSI